AKVFILSFSFAKLIYARDSMNTVSAKRTLREHNEGMKIFLPQSPVPNPQSLFSRQVYCSV
ncbi:MAG: hypothetical protein RMX65_034395, partial [Nostoc sp. DedQUE01]|nr:hypothetical protein [Nostoc sp. DedQUE01]